MDQDEQQVKVVREKPSLLRRLFYVSGILLLLTITLGTGFVVYTVNQAGEAARDAVQPIGNLWRQLSVEATPVIMPDPVTIVREINKLSNLETASYTLQKIIIAQRNQDVLWGALGESLIFEAVGDVIAGIDLSQLQAADLQIVDPDTVMIHLPPAQLLHSSLDNQQSRVIDRDKGILASVDPQLESQVRAEAELQIREAALQDGILAEAKQNAEDVMRGFLNKLGFDNVVFTDETPPPAPPYRPEIPKGVIVVTPAP